MKILITSDEELRNSIIKAIKDNDGYCCCQLEKSEKTKCMCEDFRKGEDGWCHCGLYYKISN